jgi:5-methylcytosine-specific restriction endonuclease McrBC regulatory subunit McrC
MPTDADLKQMFAYNRVFGSSESYLLYPKTAGSPVPRSGTYNEGSGSCTMDYIELFDTENRIRRELKPELQRILATGLSQVYSGGLS